MHKDRRGASGRKRTEKGGREHPEHGRDSAQGPAFGEPGCGHPGTECGERKCQEVKHHQGEGWRPEGERAEHGEHGGERVGGAHETEADVTPSVAHALPEFGRSVLQREEATAGKCSRTEQWRQYRDTQNGSGEHRPGATIGEKPNFWSVAAHTGQAGFTLEGMPAAHLGR